ncbi:unnamed protein product [Paramecium sonneborni]|uniref:Tetratricopeptide repeat protein n=1 Tax=Paramecium sonneborni TaxID=65129 RepID=A0A8S1PZX4_9CILI|nr:unnamed protein product [Paramecium sonneborni]
MNKGQSITIRSQQYCCLYEQRFIFNLYFYLIGNSLNSLQQYKDAIICFDKALQLNLIMHQHRQIKVYLIFLLIGNSLNNLQIYQDAIICYDKALQLDPNYAAVYMNKGYSLQHIDFIDFNIENFQEYKLQLLVMIMQQNQILIIYQTIRSKVICQLE